jgi:NADPH-dependent curcumin reductase
MTTSNVLRIVLASRPKGPVATSNFRLEYIPMPVPQEGQVLLRTRYLSLDPYMRARMNAQRSYARATEIGDVMPGESVAEVLESRHVEYAPGDLVLARTGWQDHVVVTGDGLTRVPAGRIGASAYLGVLGMPGFTAYVGMRVIGQARPGETVVVAAATGPVGSLVGQLAKRGGSRSVAIAGGPEKCRFAVESLRFDAAVDHKAPDFSERLAAACPDGVDVYFENIGGAIWQTVRPLFNAFARVPLCGLIGHYDDNASLDPIGPSMRDILSKKMTVRGFINYDFMDLHPDFLREVGAGVLSGDLVHREDIVEGLEQAPSAFLGMLAGKNFGKLLIRI